MDPSLLYAAVVCIGIVIDAIFMRPIWQFVHKEALRSVPQTPPPPDYLGLLFDEVRERNTQARLDSMAARIEVASLRDIKRAAAARAISPHLSPSEWTLYQQQLALAETTLAKAESCLTACNKHWQLCSNQPQDVVEQMEAAKRVIPLAAPVKH